MIAMSTKRDAQIQSLANFQLSYSDEQIWSTMEGEEERGREREKGGGLFTTVKSNTAELHAVL